MDDVTIRPLEGSSARHREALEALAREVVEAGEMFAYVEVDGVLAYWLDPTGTAFVAERADGEVLGTYVVKPNQPGRGDHVANAGYMVAERARGRGLGRRLGEHSLEVARSLGFRAMQFNFVVAANPAALALWRSLGFRCVGTLPRAFRHDALGEIDAHVLYRELDPGEIPDPPQREGRDGT